MKYPFLLLAACFIFACNSKPSSRQDRTDNPSAPIAEAVDTGHGVSPEDQYAILDSTYCNSRYDFCISYPGALVTLANESQSGDGCSFYVDNNNDFLIAFGRTNPDPMQGKPDLKKELKKEVAEFLKDSSKSHAAVTYASSGKGYYVFSGIKEGKIFYQKGITKGEDLAIAIFQYDIEQKSKYDVVVAAISKSFH